MAKRRSKSELANLPNFIFCSITGQRLAVRRDVILQRIKAAGSLERLEKTYVCRDARKLLKEGKTIEEVRAILGYDPDHANKNLTDHAAKTSSSMARVRAIAGTQVDAFWRHESFRVLPNLGRRSFTIEDVEKTTVDTCLAPNRYLDKDCRGCQYFDSCKMLIKGVYRK